MSLYRLTHSEEEIMSALWELDRAFINDILARLVEPKPPYTTVSSSVRKLVAEGLVGFESFGKTHRYYPILKKEDYRKGAFKRFLDTYFGGSPQAVLSQFIKNEQVSSEEIAELLAEIKRRESR